MSYTVTSVSVARPLYTKTDPQTAGSTPETWEDKLSIIVEDNLFYNREVLTGTLLPNNLPTMQPESYLVNRYSGPMIISTTVLPETYFDNKWSIVTWFTNNRDSIKYHLVHTNPLYINGVAEQMMVQIGAKLAEMAGGNQGGQDISHENDENYQQG